MFPLRSNTLTDMSRTKLTVEQVLQARLRYAAGERDFGKLAKDCGVTRWTLGNAVVGDGPLGVELSPKGKASFCLYQTEEKPTHLHLAFTAENRQQVDAFYRAALEAGAKTMAPLVCVRTTTRTTMQLSSLVRTGTTLKWFATNPRPNPATSVTRDRSLTFAC